MSAVYILTLSLSPAFWYASFMCLLIQGPVIDRGGRGSFLSETEKSNQCQTGLVSSRTYLLKKIWRICPFAVLLGFCLQLCNHLVKRYIPYKC